MSRINFPRGVLHERRISESKNFNFKQMTANINNESQGAFHLTITNLGNVPVFVNPKGANRELKENEVWVNEAPIGITNENFLIEFGLIDGITSPKKDVIVSWNTPYECNS